LIRFAIAALWDKRVMGTSRNVLADSQLRYPIEAVHLKFCTKVQLNEDGAAICSIPPTFVQDTA